MQAFSMQSRVTGSSVDPLSEPELLAALLVPQLETYMAANGSTRLLILHYPTIYLSTMFAMRKLLGPSLFKIAGILNCLTSEPPSFPRPQRASSFNPLSNEAVALRARLNHIKRVLAESQNPRSSVQQVSFSKANYLLPSPTTSAEMTTFLTQIRQSLISTSTFYTPEPPPDPEPRNANMPPTPTSPPPTYIQIPHHSHAQSKVSRLTNASTSSMQAQPATSRRYASSITSNLTTRTTRTTATETERRRERQTERDWANFYIGEDSDDEYERMVLGRAWRPESRARQVDAESTIRGGMLSVDVGRRKGNSKKALKFLGLA